MRRQSTLLLCTQDMIASIVVQKFAPSAGERSDAVLRTAMASPSSEFLNHKRHWNHKVASVLIESEVRSGSAAKYGELRIRDTSLVLAECSHLCEGGMRPLHSPFGRLDSAKSSLGV